MEGSFSSLSEEVEIKTKKLKKLWVKYEQARNEISDLQDEFRTEREDLLSTIREFSRDLALKVSIIENFIPIDDRLKIERRARFDEDLGEWHLSPLFNIERERLTRPTSTPHSSVPLSQFSKNAMRLGDLNLRYRKENIITPQVSLFSFGLFS